MVQAWRFLILTTTMLCSCSTQVVQGPDNTTRQEGETNVLIHCPFSISSAPIWLINSTLYEPLSLKPPLLPIATGINITVVELSYNDTTFQCFTPTGNGLQVEQSSIGTLTVIKKDDYNPPKTELQPQIVLDHQLFSFNATHKIIGWNFKNNQSCAPPVTFTVDLLTCDSDDPVQTWTTQDSELTIKSEQKKESLYFRISASDKDHAKCPATTTDFQVPSDPYVYSNELSIPLGEGECLEVPKLTKQQSLYAVWPNDDGTDCICPLCDDGKCVLSNCECYNASMFQPELKLNSSGSTPDDTVYSLCLSNLTTDRNNSKMSFFYEELSCTENNMPFLSRKYDENSIFVLRGPPLPPALDVTQNNVCFNCYSYYPIDNFTVKISDSTGDVQTVSQSSKSNDPKTCFSLSEDSFPAECSPYEVIVTAHNKVGFSNASNVTLQETNGDICSCMKHKIDIELSVSKITESSVLISMNCTELLPSKFKDFAIKVTDSKSTSSQNVSFPCLADLHFTNLIPNTTFNITVIWFDLTLPTECNIEEFTTLPGLPPAPLLNISKDTVCFLSNTYYPVTYYTVDIIDRMGENHSVTVNVSNPSSNETEACTSLYEAAFLSECSPYNVSVRAHNKVGSSNVSTTTLIENKDGDICSCMGHKIDVELSVSDITDSSVQISVNCTELLPSKFKNFVIKVTDDKSCFSQNVSYPCLTDLHFTNLMPNTIFNITVVWLDLSQPAECNIEEFATLLGLPSAPLLNITGDTVCFLSNTYFPVTYYTIDVVDLMGENHSVTVNVSNPSSNETEACTSLYEAAFPSECSPYNVSVRAHNKVGSSNMSTTTLIERNGGDICSCMEQKITVEVKALQISDSLIELRVNCTEQLPTEIDSLTVTLTSYGSEKSTSYSQNISLPCPKTMRFSELTPDTTFSVKLVWYEHVLPAAIIECALDNNYTTSAGLPPSPPTLNYTEDSLCYTSDSYYPIDYYIIELTDFSGEEQTFNESSTSGIDGCIQLSETNFASNCTPYDVIGRAHNKIGTSSASEITMGHTNGNMCLCMEEKVAITLDINEAIKTDSSIQFNSNCTKVLPLTSSESIDITIELKSDKELHNQSMQCDSTSSKLKFDELTPSTAYNVTVIWFLRSSGRIVKCPFMEMILTDPAHHGSERHLLIIIPSVVSVLVFILSLILIPTSYVIFKKKRKHNMRRNEGGGGKGC